MGKISESNVFAVEIVLSMLLESGLMTSLVC